ncbi:MAG TPA: signal peptidase II [Kineosporiaceae bacterium]|nr:signal peptidase II [Kineosporiaceae bacterium]
MTDVNNARRRLPLLVPVIAALVLLADQATKWAAVERLAGRGRVDVIDGILWLHLTRNAGAAFSMATGATWLLTIVALVVVVAIIRISRNLGSRGWTLALGLLLGGALGNLGDRLFRAPSFFHGHVIDFLEFPHWPIFNLADSSIVTAAVLIALLSLRGIGIDGQRLNRTEEPAVADDPVPQTQAATTPADRSGVSE